MKGPQDQNDQGGNSRDKDPDNHPELTEGALLEMRVRGQLDRGWSDWFGGLELQLLGNGEMLLSGRIEDQAALIGILFKLNRLNLALLSIRWSEK